MTDTCTQRLYALASDFRTAARVEADMAGMLERQGLSAAKLRSDPLEWLAAQTRCGACGAIDRCHQYLTHGSDDPAEFCANAGEFAALEDLRSS